MCGNEFNVIGAHDFRDHGQACFFADFAEQLQGFQSKALEIIRRGAGLVSAAAQHGRTCCLHCPGRAHELFA